MLYAEADDMQWPRTFKRPARAALSEANVNIFSGKSGCALIAVSDFGCATRGGGLQSRCSGTPAFLAPEMMAPTARYRLG